MFKERSLPVYHHGQPDGRQSTLTAVKTNAQKPVDRTNIEGSYATGESDAATGPLLTGGSNPYIGAEVFSSTENHIPQFNNCVHFKDRDETFPYLYVAATYYGSNYNKWLYYFRNVLPFYPPQSMRQYEGSLYNASSRAWWNMQPRFEGEMSLLNFILELKDFRDVAKLLLAKQGVHHLKKALRPLKRFPDPSKSAAGLHLFKNFVWDPLVKDLGTIIAQLQSIVAEAQAEFAALGSMRQKSHYSEYLNQSIIEIVPGTGTKRTMTTRSDFFTATLEYKYDFTPWRAHQAFMRFWGLRMTPEAIWNALPFSFMADYFVNIGKSLNAMELDPNVSLIVHQYCESILTKYDQGVHMVGDSLTKAVYCDNHISYGQPSFPVFLSGRRGTTYVRTVKRPNKSMLLFKTKAPSDGQLMNMLALARCFIG